ncbi:hypothetical protein L596_016025 [Steinernema carpocapsae]|uniref:Aquaporin n=1 Tax=Steinernema carpocapsae TaxID=34508 RepID=A0A4U5NGS2_STECR|nr:hypothetical protein L596_016025 [Steinernema carpocapsae]
MTTENAYHQVFFVAVAYHAGVFLVCEMAKRVVERRFSPKSLTYFFLMELLCTINTTVGSYENGIMIKTYGPWAIVYIIVSAIFFGKFNRGAFGSPLAPFEAFTNRNLSTAKLSLVLIAEAIALFVGYPTARFIWANTFWALDAHKTSYMSTNCELSWKASRIVYVFAYEMVNGFLMRTAFQTPGKLKAAVIPLYFTTSMSFAGKYIGSPGITPILATCRFLGCENLSLEEFFLTYWIAPLIGWMASAKLLPAPAPERSKEKTN